MNRTELRLLVTAADEDVAPVVPQDRLPLGDESCVEVVVLRVVPTADGGSPPDDAA
jgi:hypothetical protein